MTARAIAGTISLVALTACQGPPPEQEQPPVRELSTPLLRSVAPTAIHAGDEMTILGADFADKAMGETRIIFDGVYQSTAGKVTQVTLEVTPVFVNQGVLTWTFGPNIPFTTDEDTGVFRGVVRARNVGMNGQTKEAPQALGTELTVLPSIIVRQLRAQAAGCSAGTTETIAESKVVLEVKAVGLKAGSDLAPLRFVYTFMKEAFSFSGYLSSQLGMDPEALFPKAGPVSVIDEVRNGTVSSLGAGAPRNVYVYKGAFTPGLASIATGTENLFGMTDLQTSALPGAAAYQDTIMNIVAVDSAGGETSRGIKLRIWTPVEVKYDGNSRVVRSFDPVPVSGCIPGGDIGRDVTYTESSSETRNRTFSVHTNTSAGIDIKVVHLNAGFGFDVQTAVSSSQSKDLTITSKILPKEFGVFYRQTLQLERRGKLIGHGACGETIDLGEAVVTDWTWSPDLAKGPVCPPLPPSNLPPGKVFE